MFNSTSLLGVSAEIADPVIKSNVLYDWVFLVPATMAVSFLLILFFGKRMKYQGAEIGITAISLCFLFAIATSFSWIIDTQQVLNGDKGEKAAAVVVDDGGDKALTVLGAGETAAPLLPIVEEGEKARVTVNPVVQERVWLENGEVEFSVGTLVDGQSVMLLFVVTFISLLVHVFSTDYVAGDSRYTHYFAFLSLFTASMLFMVFSTNTLQLIVGWELVGVCSFALIGHWWEHKPNSDAALKAFLTNRVGDIGLLVGMIILFFGAGGTFDILEINSKAVAGEIDHNLLLIASCCLMAAVASKSGQFILHTWLPDAMAGPTPVSALIHAATMVVAGVYMIGRLYPVFWDGLTISGSTINLMALMGGITCVFGGALAFVQNDVKKVLAYSTVSQLGYMVLALGVGAFTAGFFHLFTHAFFKACLFLGAGSLSHANHHSFDMREMGGLRKIMPKTFATFTIGSLALAGAFPFAGFWSKDEILAGAGVWPGTGGNGTYYIPFWFGMLTAAMTAGYMARVMWLVFFGEYRGNHHPHENGNRITVPLIILAGMATVVGFLNLPKPFAEFFGLKDAALAFEHWVEPASVAHFPAIDHASPSLSLAIVATLLAGGAAAAVWMYYRRLYAIDPRATSYTDHWIDNNRLLKAGHTFLVEKYYLDHLYTHIIAGGTKGPLAKAAYWFNQNVLDGTVNTAGKSAAASGRFIYRFIDQGAIDGAVNASGLSASGTGQVLRGIQSGKIRQYATLMFGAAAVLAGVFIVVV